MKNKNPVSLILIGIILLFIGGGLYFTGSSSSISAEQEAGCIHHLKHKYNGNPDPALVEMCKKSVGWVAQMNAEANGAQSAEELAKAISSANQQEAGLGIFGKFLMGLCVGIGIVMLIRGIMGLKNKQPSTT